MTWNAWKCSQLQSVLVLFVHNCKFATPSIFDDPLYSLRNDGPPAANARRVSCLVPLMTCLCVTVTIHIFCWNTRVILQQKGFINLNFPYCYWRRHLTSALISSKDKTSFVGLRNQCLTSYGLMKDHLQETMKLSPISYPLTKELEIMPSSPRHYSKKGQEIMM